VPIKIFNPSGHEKFFRNVNAQGFKMKNKFLHKAISLEEEIDELYSKFSNYEHLPDTDALVRKVICASNLRSKLGDYCLELEQELGRRFEKELAGRAIKFKTF
jgi:hypothetical protein